MVNWNTVFQFDLQQLRLRNARTGRQCMLTRNESLLLQALIEGITSKQDLIDEVWTRHHTVVSENSYYQLVSLLRKSFTSIDLPGAIVTLPRKGVALQPPPAGSEDASLLDAHVDLGRIEEMWPFMPGSPGDPAVASATKHLMPAIESTPSPSLTQNEITKNATESSAALGALASLPGQTGSPIPSSSISPSYATNPAHDSQYDATQKPKLAPTRRSVRSRLKARFARACAALDIGRSATAAGLGLGTTLVILVAANAVMPEPLARQSTGNALLPAATPANSIMLGNTQLSYSQMSTDAALRIWRDVQARAALPQEQTRHIYIAQHRNRYAVLACSEPLDLQTIRCSTITVSV